MIDIVITIFIISLALVLKNLKLLQLYCFYLCGFYGGKNTWNGDYKM